MTTARFPSRLFNAGFFATADDPEGVHLTDMTADDLHMRDAQRTLIDANHMCDVASLSLNSPGHSAACIIMDSLTHTDTSVSGIRCTRINF